LKWVDDGESTTIQKAMFKLDLRIVEEGTATVESRIPGSDGWDGKFPL
jgi:hypothetical protein